MVPGKNPLRAISGVLFDIRAELKVGEADALEFTVRGVSVLDDLKTHAIACAGKSAPLRPIDGRLRLRLLVDRGSIEVVGNDGQVAISAGVIPADENRSLALFTRDGSAEVRALDVVELMSA